VLAKIVFPQALRCIQAMPALLAAILVRLTQSFRLFELIFPNQGSLALRLAKVSKETPSE